MKLSAVGWTLAAASVALILFLLLPLPRGSDPTPATPTPEPTTGTAARPVPSPRAAPDQLNQEEATARPAAPENELDRQIQQQESMLRTLDRHILAAQDRLKRADTEEQRREIQAGIQLLQQEVLTKQEQLETLRRQLSVAP